MPGGFVALFVVVVIAGVAMSAVNAGKAREIAERTGDDPGSALRRMWFAKDPRAELRQDGTRSRDAGAERATGPFPA